MKKLIVVIMLGMVLVGCGATHQYLMIQNSDEKYGLLELESDEQPEFTYDNYTSVNEAGYIVQKGDEVGYISVSGKELIKLGEYQKIINIEQMMIAYGAKNEVTIFNQVGKELYKQDKETKIIISELPIIKKDKEYIVLHADGTELLTDKKEIKYVSIISTMSIVVGYKDAIDIVDTVSKKSQTVKLSGTYKYMADQKDNGYLLYDDEAKKIAYITNQGKLAFTMDQEAESLYFDGNKNIIVKNQDKLWLLSVDGEKKQEINSYYQNNKTYVIKNNDYIYGPHSFYQEGQEVVVDGVQLDPLASYTKHDIFPVFVKEKGYQFYSFDGKAAFDVVYRKATAFDKNGCAIVSEDGEKYYLINIKNEKKSKEYVQLKDMGNNFYAGYTNENRYEIINDSGKVVLDTYFMGSKSIVMYQDVIYGIFNKSGKSYVYDMNTYTLLFSCEGDVVLNTEGYFVNDNKVYYSMKGEKIYSR